MKEIKVNDTVKFSKPATDEIGLTMKVIELNGDRALVEYNVNMTIKPSAVIRVSDIEKC